MCSPNADRRAFINRGVRGAVATLMARMVLDCLDAHPQ